MTVAKQQHLAQSRESSDATTRQGVRGSQPRLLAAKARLSPDPFKRGRGNTPNEQEADMPDVLMMRLEAAMSRHRFTRRNKRGEEEEVQEVRLLLRKKSGQWLASVGDVSRTGTSMSEALQRVLDALEA